MPDKVPLRPRRRQARRSRPRLQLHSPLRRRLPPRRRHRVPLAGPAPGRRVAMTLLRRAYRSASGWCSWWLSRDWERCAVSRWAYVRAGDVAGYGRSIVRRVGGADDDTPVRSAWIGAWRELQDTAWDCGARWPATATDRDIADVVEAALPCEAAGKVSGRAAACVFGHGDVPAPLLKDAADVRAAVEGRRRFMPMSLFRRR